MTEDPVEKIIGDALDSAGIRYTTETSGRGPFGEEDQLDFLLTDLGVHIEVCRFHTPRKIEQLSRFDDVILIQGIEAAKAFAGMIAGAKAQDGKSDTPKV